MLELIDRQVAIDSIYVVAESIICAVEEESPEIADKIVVVRDLILKKIKEQPTIEAEPVRHGRWIFGSSKTSCWMTCSICCKSQSGQTATFSYCPNCGAYMRDGGADNGCT